MTFLLWIAGTYVAGLWLFHLIDAAIGATRIPVISQPEWDLPLPGRPRLSIIVPARNEDEHMEATLTRLLQLDYDNYEVIAVNDRSTDRTGEVMDHVAASCSSPGRLKVIHIDSLPANWLGKPHAMWTAANHAHGEWLLFTDADVQFAAQSVRRALVYAEASHSDHLVLLPRMIMHQAGETMMLAFFQTLFVFGHRPWKTADPKAKDHIGVGAFNLIRRSVYDSLGGYKALRFEVLDDMKLGKRVKNGGYVQRVVFGDDLISIRWAKGALGVIENLTKNLFALMSFRWPLALFSSVVLLFVNVMPFVGVLVAHGWARLPFAAALLAMFAIYVGMSWRSDVPPYYFVLHPVSATLFAYTMLRSTLLTLKRGGVIWRGTFYPLDELRKGLV